MDDGERILLKETLSVCPVCLSRIGGRVIREGGTVFLEKECGRHGKWKIPLWRGEPRYEDWTRPGEPVTPEVAYHGVERGCPFDCGLCPAHRQYPCSVLLEITERCNLQCPVCFADARKRDSAAEEPGLERIGFWYDRVRHAAGTCNIQLSGGEPTLRDDLPEIIALGISKGFSFIQVNTNGIRLAREEGYGATLREAGLSTVFLQFDGTEEEIYSALRGRPLLDEKRQAIERCREAGLGVILVPTLVPGVNTDNIGSIIRFAVDHTPVVRGVHMQPVSLFGRHPFGGRDNERITLPEVMRAIEAQAAGLADRWNFLPPGTENNHCSFHSSFIVMGDGRLRSITPAISGCCQSPAGGKSVQKTVSTIARKWSPAAQAEPAGASPTGGLSCCDGVIDLDTFLERGANYSFSLSAMAFQDAWNLDIDRLRDCCISVMSPEGQLIPFCAYNLTGGTGEKLYRESP